MNVETYQRLKESRLRSEAEALARLRAVCERCRKTRATCYCAEIRPFASGPEFVLLIHPKEHRKRVGTGRLTHLCLTNSRLIEGVDFTANAEVNRILEDESAYPVVLYPGPRALDLTAGAAEKLEAAVPEGRRLVIFIIDGSWFCAKKMLRLSQNLKTLPQLKFTPPHRSTYEIRRQPKAICFSSVEAVHFMIDQLKGSRRWPCANGEHANLLDVFRHLVRQQLRHVERPHQKAVRGHRARAEAE